MGRRRIIDSLVSSERVTRRPARCDADRLRGHIRRVAVAAMVDGGPIPDRVAEHPGHTR